MTRKTFFSIYVMRNDVHVFLCFIYLNNITISIFLLEVIISYKILLTENTSNDCSIYLVNDHKYNFGSSLCIN